MGYHCLSGKPPICCVGDCIKAAGQPGERLPWPRAMASVMLRFDFVDFVGSLVALSSLQAPYPGSLLGSIPCDTLCNLQNCFQMSDPPVLNLSSPFHSSLFDQTQTCSGLSLSCNIFMACRFLQLSNPFHVLACFVTI